VTVFNYTVVDPASSVGVMTHFWTTGSRGSDALQVAYRVDGEAVPSLVFNPAMATGVGFPQYASSIGNRSVFQAGDKMGKNAAVGGWYNYFRVPFQSSITIQVVAPDSSSCETVYIIVRGYEANRSATPGLVLSPFLTVPWTARMRLQAVQGTFPPLAFVPLVALPAGQAGVLFLSTLALNTTPAANNYIEGCWHLYPEANSSFPGIVLGTGFEDFYDSAYWFSAATSVGASVPFLHPSAGLTHFSRANNVEEVGAYRFFDQEVVGFRNGGSLQWRVGDQVSKCTTNTTDHPIGVPAAVSLTSYAWLYTWPNGLPPPPPPPPPQPPSLAGCADGTCDAFCQLDGVAGCHAGWTGAQSLRASRQGPADPAPADACAEGWEVCLASVASFPTRLADFRSRMSASSCRSGSGVDPQQMYVGAMQHAVEPCPAGPVASDNGCAPTGWGSEPVCCGGGCSLPSCANALYPNGTLIHIGTNEGCGSLTANYISGVLCCRLPTA
jgi:hypothetical protein